MSEMEKKEAKRKILLGSGGRGNREREKNLKKKK
jgi:hypothetical protein